MDGALEQKLSKKDKKGRNEEFDYNSEKENIDDNNLSSISTIVDVPILNIPYDEMSIDGGNSKQPLLFSGKYFEIIFKDPAHTKAKCLTCNSVYSTTGSTTSNLITHLKVVIITH